MTARLDRVRARGTGPDPRFRAELRERLVTAAAGRGEDSSNSGQRDDQYRAR